MANQVETGARALFASEVARLQANGFWRNTPLAIWETTHDEIRKEMIEKASVVLGVQII
jgi:hypothetical protein